MAKANSSQALLKAYLRVKKKENVVAFKHSNAEYNVAPLNYMGSFR
jgi:hypothetical protein